MLLYRLSSLASPPETHSAGFRKLYYYGGPQQIAGFFTGQDVFEISRDGSGRVGSGRVRRYSNSHGSGRATHTRPVDTPGVLRKYPCREASANIVFPDLSTPAFYTDVEKTITPPRASKMSMAPVLACCGVNTPS